MGELPVYGYSVRWTGKILVPVSATYNITLTVKDGVRLLVGNTKYINSSVNQSTPTKHSVGLWLTGGQKVPIKIEYYKNSGAGTVQLMWSQNGGTSVVIPMPSLISQQLLKRITGIK